MSLVYEANLMLRHLSRGVQRIVLLPLEEEAFRVLLDAGWCEVSDVIELHVVVDTHWAPVVKYGVHITPTGRKRLGELHTPRLVFSKTGT